MASTEIQRFSLAKGIAVWGLYADPQGEWVRWEDVHMKLYGEAGRWSPTNAEVPDNG